MVAKHFSTQFKLKRWEQTLEHSEHIQAVNNDCGGQSGEGIYETCEDSFACNLIYFSPVPLPDQQAPRKGFISEVQFYIKWKYGSSMAIFAWKEENKSVN